MTLEQMIHLLHWGNREAIIKMWKITEILKKVGIYSLKDGKELSTNSRSWTAVLARAGYFLEERDKLEIQSIEMWLNSKILVNKNLLSMEGWKWAEDSTKNEAESATELLSLSEEQRPISSESTNRLSVSAKSLDSGPASPQTTETVSRD
ncbi:hypothetical protein R1sor_000893 [Riccia sorocarpa]|uniref:Uncharacterized protein n=1 Tax=Riccia sorocarpa TaxID=122646 RepID=A0ABD3GYM7_9MARC